MRGEAGGAGGAGIERRAAPDPHHGAGDGAERGGGEQSGRAGVGRQHLVERAARQPAPRQMGIERGRERQPRACAPSTAFQGAHTVPQPVEQGLITR